MFIILLMKSAKLDQFLVAVFWTALPDFLKAIVKFLSYEKRFLILYDNTNNVILDKKNCLFLNMSWRGLLLYNDVLFTKKILKQNNSIYMEYDVFCFLSKKLSENYVKNCFKFIWILWRNYEITNYMKLLLIICSK